MNDIFAVTDSVQSIYTFLVELKPKLADTLS